MRFAIPRLSHGEPPVEGAGGVRPARFVPPLYVMQAIPVSLVQDVIGLAYKDAGVDNATIARWTSIAALPWALQFLFGPIVDRAGERRRWTLAGQLGVGILLFATPLLLRLPFGFEASIVALLALATASTVANVATDGFYLLALPPREQARFAGVQSVSYRLGTFVCKGLAVMLAGWAGGRFGGPAAGWSVALGCLALVYLGGSLGLRKLLPRPAEPRAERPASKREPLVAQTAALALAGLAAYFAASALVRLGADGLSFVWPGMTGWRLSDSPRALGVAVGHSGAAAETWQLAACLVVALLPAAWLARSLRGSEAGEIFGSFFRPPRPGLGAARTQGPRIGSILCFLMFYRFAEAMIVKMAPLFLEDSRRAGGLGLSLEAIGRIRGVVGVGGIMAGGLLGGFTVARFGLRRAFWPVALVMHAPALLYMWAAFAQPGARAMYPIDFAEQFGYGFGFAAYAIFLMRVAGRGRYPTSHYAIGVGIGALFISVAGVASGVVQANFGYRGLFVAAAAAALPGLFSLYLVRGQEDPAGASE